VPRKKGLQPGDIFLDLQKINGRRDLIICRGFRGPDLSRAQLEALELFFGNSALCVRGGEAERRSQQSARCPRWYEKLATPVAIGPADDDVLAYARWLIGVAFRFAEKAEAFSARAATAAASHQTPRLPVRVYAPLRGAHA